MNKICQICGHNGENVWRDGKYYCAACGSEIDVTKQDANTNSTFSAETKINAVCPICKNANNNTLRNGNGHCALCGSTFSLNQQPESYGPDISMVGDSYKYAKISELEDQKSKKLFWGIVWLFLFWPVAVYQFYKVYEISQEIKKL